MNVDITEFWKYVLEQDADKIRAFLQGWLCELALHERAF